MHLYIYRNIIPLKYCFKDVEDISRKNSEALFQGFVSRALMKII